MPYSPKQLSGCAACVSSHVASYPPGHPKWTRSIRGHVLRFEIPIPEGWVYLSPGEKLTWEHVPQSVTQAVKMSINSGRKWSSAEREAGDQKVWKQRWFRWYLLLFLRPSYISFVGLLRRYRYSQWQNLSVCRAQHFSKQHIIWVISEFINLACHCLPLNESMVSIYSVHQLQKEEWQFLLTCNSQNNFVLSPWKKKKKRISFAVRNQHFFYLIAQ